MIWLVGAACFTTTAMGGVTFETPPVEGEETVVVVVEGTPGGDLAEDSRPVGGATVRAVYRPGLPGQHEQAIGITDGRGRARWTPTEGGVAIVRANDDALDVRVTPARPPATTLALATILALGAAGSAAWGLSRRRR